MPSSDIGSVRSDRHGVPTSDGETDVTVWAYNSRLRGASTFLSSYSESTQNLGSIGYLVDLSDFCVLSYGSVSDFRLETDQSPTVWTKDSPRKSKTEPLLDTEKSESSIKCPIDPEFCVDSENELRNVLPSRNREL